MAVGKESEHEANAIHLQPHSPGVECLRRPSSHIDMLEMGAGQLDAGADVRAILKDSGSHSGFTTWTVCQDLSGVVPRVPSIDGASH